MIPIDLRLDLAVRSGPWSSSGGSSFVALQDAKALALAQEAYLRHQIPMVAAPLGAAYVLTGRTADALPLLEQAIEQAVAMDYMSDHALRVIWLSEAYLLAGRLDEVFAQAEAALAQVLRQGEAMNAT